MARRLMTRACAFLFVAILTAGMLTACTTIETGAYSAERANFSEYQTFSWINADPYVAAEDAAPVSPLARSMIAREIREQLVRIGFTYTDDREAADMLVSYTIGSRDKVRMDAYPVGYRGHWGWHTPRSHYYFRDVELKEYTQGTLGVDIFDNETGRPIWHGWAKKTVTDRDRQNPGPTIEKGVAQLFESFAG